MNKFKKFLSMVCMAALIVSFGACDNGGSEGEDDDTPPTTSNETTSEFDNSNFGLYKGVLAGSSGTIRIEVNNGNNTAKAYITIDNKSDELTCTSTLTKGQAIENAIFTGTFSEFTFSVGADGKNPVIVDITIEGHDNVITSLSKETSANVTICYQGTTTGGQDHKGVFNCVRNNDTFSVIMKAVDGFSFSSKGNVDKDGNFQGSGKTTFMGLSVTVNYTGKFNGDKISGTWSNSWEGGSNAGSFSGNKAL